MSAHVKCLEYCLLTWFVLNEHEFLLFLLLLWEPSCHIVEEMGWCRDTQG